MPGLLNRYCDPECNWLSPTEAEQNTMTIKGDHICGKFGTRLIHGANEPDILKCEQCLRKGIKRDFLK